MQGEKQLFRKPLQRFFVCHIVSQKRKSKDFFFSLDGWGLLHSLFSRKMRRYATIFFMKDRIETASMIAVLKRRLEPIARVPWLVDEIEGERPEARKAAVLLCLLDREGAPELVFIRRSDRLRSHRGEIAFPGGKPEEGDLTLVETALREAEEEIGLRTARAEVLGALSPVFTVVSNFFIQPIVAYLPDGLGDLHVQQSEVSEVFVASLQALREPQIYHNELWQKGGQSRVVHFYDYGSYRIWGATARILHTLLELLDVSSDTS